ncbi:Protein of uncharacterised function (DUF3307) [Fusobacterium polymorphum]|uniref:DUF3307 domain-containing protein n=1 Tax=Fusobacterium polymorphum ATCC 10953 TaxID=393480 RepID=A5TUI3_FUSNP|nr:DUF3307 domain-containing protein [Fusobacterium polymorphum]EDK88558.1 hypothetical protein FNP_0756 [Fusobacterium polymorphum ATCC 10953]UTI54116.1 DUF3307 domain-containing protein [Fusobacterium polymorphum]WRL68667.1 DUF3307 domain-containing protein [Fusobacterium polymorphum]CKG90731.1 Protein of uncharacterised function (DUF3307) [Fusobacterium polymorphum]
MTIAILISIHLLADFLFQTSIYSEKKRKKLKPLLLHCFIYFIVFEIVLLPILQFKKAFLLGMIISVLHFFINFTKNKLEKSFPQRRLQIWIFSINQLIHFVILIGMYYIFNLENSVSNLYVKLQAYENFKIIILYISVFSIIFEPASVFIRKLFTSISPKTSPKENLEELKAGNIIGKLERIIIAILLLNNQFGVIGFVLTAKSIARFKQMEDKNFAEKYLIGTLTSFLIVLATVLILKGLL